MTFTGRWERLLASPTSVNSSVRTILIMQLRCVSPLTMEPLGYTHLADPFWPCKNPVQSGHIREHVTRHVRRGILRTRHHETFELRDMRPGLGEIREEFATVWDRLAKYRKPDLAGESRLLLERAGAPIRLIPIPRSAGQRRTRSQ